MHCHGWHCHCVFLPQRLTHCIVTQHWRGKTSLLYINGFQHRRQKGWSRKVLWASLFWWMLQDWELGAGGAVQVEARDPAWHLAVPRKTPTANGPVPMFPVPRMKLGISISRNYAGIPAQGSSIAVPSSVSINGRRAVAYLLTVWGNACMCIHQRAPGQRRAFFWRAEFAAYVNPSWKVFHLWVMTSVGIVSHCLSVIKIPFCTIHASINPSFKV